MPGRRLVKATRREEKDRYYYTVRQRPVVRCEHGYLEG
jgi:hypothetical protein